MLNASPNDTSWVTRAKNVADAHIKNALGPEPKDNDPAINPIRDKMANYGFSSVVDKETGYQYVDIVFEGGGMLGIALVGYTYVLEQLGIRFRSVAGTSAGAINAVLQAAVQPDDNGTKSAKLLDIMASTEFMSFVDGIKGGAGATLVQSYINAFLDGTLQNEWQDKGKLGKAWMAFQKLDDLQALFGNVQGSLGLNQGDVFEEWLGDVLFGETAHTLALLEQRLKESPRLHHWDGTKLKILKPEASAPELKLISSDITTSSRAIFPHDAPLYFATEGKNVSVARFARASMAIPFFFTPHIAENPSDDLELWEQHRGFGADELPQGTPPKRVLFVDGGLISNFPFDVLHAPSGSAPKMPTFGVKLEVDHRLSTVGGLGDYLGAIVSSARRALDNKYTDKYHEEYKTLVKEVAIRKGINWLDFAMSPSNKEKLFEDGALAAIDFVKNFDWKAYLAMRMEK